jgi:hypothetical protein
MSGYNFSNFLSKKMKYNFPRPTTSGPATTTAASSANKTDNLFFKSANVNQKNTNQKTPHATGPGNGSNLLINPSDFI